ncbi:uncharacterized protein LOC129595799 [Paramacrobiotus metropolitanus]|uniref:uncharacterized protein LOC129595799 n=1 Tax=Paramacrobiotus metropolitanus TaxID=2943436 RepID=UPI002445EA7D|nr:uncharacterized protein LOC129595799 [Paramacrobiotus metropolitanus]
MLLPKMYCSMSAEEIRRQMTGGWMDHTELQMWSVAFVDILDDYLWFIERPRRDCAADQVLDSCTATSTKFHESLMECFARVIRVPHSATVEFENEEAQCVLTALSVEVWLEVFSQLDTLKQNQLRAVCETFSCLLDSAILTANIVVTTTESSQMKNYDRRDYYVVTPIFKCLSSSTKRIIVADRKPLLSDCDIYKVLDMIHYVAEQKSSLRLPALYFQGFRCSFQIGLSYDSVWDLDECVQHWPKPAPRKFNGIIDELHVIRLDGFIAACQNLPCDGIRLLNCSVHVNHVNGWPDMLKPQFTSKVSMARLEKANNLECAVWEAFEIGLPTPTLEQQQMLTQWLTTVASAANQNVLVQVACKVLCATQTADRRGMLHYRGKKWCIDGLQNLQLEKLSRIAVHFLIRLAEIGKK